MKTKKILAMLLSSAMLIGTLAACGSAKQEPTAPAQQETKAAAEPTKAETSGRAGTVTVGINCNIPGLSCFDGTSTGQLYINQVINDTLFTQLKPGGDLKPCVGKSYTVEDDGAKVTVELFDYVKDSAGNPITAKDVVFSYNTYIATGNASNLDPYIESMEAVGDTTVVFNMKNYKEVNALQNVLIGSSIVAEAAYNEATWSTSPIGCGPYVVDEFVSGASLTLKANENYWQTDEQYLAAVKQRNVDKIFYKIILEDAQLALAMETRTVDAVNFVSSDNLPFFIDAAGNALPGYTVRKDDSALVVNISFSMDKSSNVANDPALRQAILYCIDSASLVKGSVDNTGEAVYCVGSSVYSDYNPEWEADYYNYNVDKAKELLAQSSYTANGSPAIRIAFETNDSKQKAAQMMQAYMNAVGINAEILSYDAALFTNYKLDFSQWDIKIDNNGSPAYKLGAFWGRFFGNTFCSYNGQGVNFFGLNDPELQKLLDVAFNVDTMGQDATNAVYDYITDNAFCYGLWTPLTYQVAQSGILEIVNNNAQYCMPNAYVYAPDYQGVAG